MPMRLTSPAKPPRVRVAAKWRRHSGATLTPVWQKRRFQEDLLKSPQYPISNPHRDDKLTNLGALKRLNRQGISGEKSSLA